MGNLQFLKIEVTVYNNTGNLCLGGKISVINETTGDDYEETEA